MTKAPQKVEHGEVTPAKLRELLALREKGSSGPWQLKSGGLGGMFRSIGITTWWRDRRDNKDGEIASVSCTRTIYDRERDGPGRYTTSHTHDIKTAQDDAKLIVEAVNWLEPLAKALLSGEQLDETAWLIEYDADKFGPIRYYSAGDKLPVISASDATRFSRECDAQAIIRELKTGGRATEHKWVTPAQGTSASGQDAQQLGAQPAGPVGSGADDAP